MMLSSLVFGWHLTNRFVGALNVAETVNVELEQRVAQKHEELAQNFTRLQEMERRAAVAEERRRLMSEMHDGIGSRLIATLDLVEHGEPPRSEIAAELREVLDGLRLTIDSMEPTDNDLLAVLGNLRYRLEGRLKRQGIVLDWQVRDIPKLASLTPQNVLHILRIVQEAFTNIIKHAGARRSPSRAGSTKNTSSSASPMMGVDSPLNARAAAWPTCVGAPSRWGRRWKSRHLPASTTLSLYLPRSP